MNYEKTKQYSCKKNINIINYILLFSGSEYSVEEIEENLISITLDCQNIYRQVNINNYTS